MCLCNYVIILIMKNITSLLVHVVILDIFSESTLVEIVQDFYQGVINTELFI